MSFAAAVDHLHGLTQELVAHSDAPRRKFDLEHMRVLAAALGDPQRQFPAILIAGTNGKGSTAATLAAILAVAGVRTGLYTSPHLARVTERIRVSNVLRSPFSDVRSETASARPPTTDNEQRTTDNRLTEIPEEAFARLYFRVDETARELVAAGRLPHHPSFFETLTALAFLYFAERKVELAVLEVGLGGRLDATNIVEPLLSIITDIALDHQDYLGNTIAEIAREKAGILRPNGTLITLPQLPEANQAIGEAALALNVRGVNAAAYLPDAVRSPFSVGRSTGPAASAPNEQRTTNNGQPLQPNHYDLFVGGETLRVRSPLAGEHQRRNLALAIAAAIALSNHHSYIFARLDHKCNEQSNASTISNLEPRTSNLEPRTLALFPAIEAGIANTAWPGRLEFLPPNLLLDVAHNPAGAWTLRAAIATLPEDQPRTLIFSCLRDKDLTEMSRILFPLFDAPASNLEPRTLNLILSHIDSPRAAGLDDLVAAARALDIPAQAAHDATAALALARSLTPAGGLILATGSIYLVGAVREAALAQESSAR